MKSFSRRKFLQISSATFASAAALGTINHVTKGSKLFAGDKTKTGTYQVPTYCNLCFWKCGAIATVKDGKLWKIEGNPLDPLSNGRLCPRGTGGVGAYSDPTRLKSPLIRTGARGNESWKVVTWDEAFNYIADKLNTIKAKHGPEAVAYFSHGIGGNFIKHTFKAFGTPG